MAGHNVDARHLRSRTQSSVLDHQQRGPRFLRRIRPGDNLYTACVLALDPDTGKLKWYFQFTPHDLYDYDANQTPVLVDVEDGGVTRHLLVQANRNGFLYVLDRTNGKFLKATPFVQRLNWATGVDASGRPVLSGRIPTKQGTYICPGIIGATNWFSPSYNPDLKLFYVMALETCNLFFSEPRPFTPGQTFYATGTKLRLTNTHRKTCWHIQCPKENWFGVIPKSARAIPGEERWPPQVDWFSSVMTPTLWKQLMLVPATLSGTSIPVRRCMHRR